MENFPAAPDAAPQATTHTLTIPEVVQRFATAGVPRAPRTIQTYCQVGTLDCIRVPGELGLKYLVNEQSVENRIKEFIQMRDLLAGAAGGDAEARLSAQERVEARSSAQERATPGVSAAESNAEKILELQNALKRIDELEKQTQKLEIDRLWRDQMIDQLNSQRQQLLSAFVEQARQLGRLEAKLALLEAPKGDSSRAREGDEGLQ